MTTISSQLRSVLLVFEKEMDPIPDSILQCPQPKDWNNPTDEEFRAVLNCAERTDEYVERIVKPKLNEMEVAIEDINILSSGLKERHRQYTHEKPVIFNLAKGVYLAINSLGAAIYKTNKVVASVIFTDGDWRSTYEKYKRPAQIAFTVSCAAVLTASIWVVSKMCYRNH